MTSPVQRGGQQPIDFRREASVIEKFGQQRISKINESFTSDQFKASGAMKRRSSEQWTESKVAEGKKMVGPIKRARLY